MSSLACQLPAELASCGRAVHLGDHTCYQGPGTLVRADRLVEQVPALLAAMRERYAGEDIRALLSQWSKYYFSVFVAAAVVVATGLRQPLHMGLDTSHVVLHDGMPQALWLPADAVGATVDDPAERYRSLCMDHLAPLIEAFAAAARMAPRVLWSNVGHTLEYAFSTLHESARTAVDKAYLFESRTFLDSDAPNPLLHAIRYIKPASPLLPNPLRVRRVCCLRYLLPGEEILCSSCPLFLKLPESAIADQARLLRECR